MIPLLSVMVAVGALVPSPGTGPAEPPSMYTGWNGGGVALPPTVVVAIAGPQELATTENTFWDDDDNVHEPFIEAIAAEGITRGCGGVWDDLFCPARVITRGEMAAFLSRALRLPPSEGNRFVDDDDSIFHADIDALAAAGITAGCAADRYCPDRPLSRAEMAGMLVRGFGYRSPTQGNRFGDDDGSTFEADIDALAAAGVAKGCDPPVNTRYCPDEPVRRDQMASFLGRALDLEPLIPRARLSRTMAFTGDTLIHTPLAIRAGRYGDESGAAYDFRPMFGPVRRLLETTDLALCHLEVPLTGASRGVSGYPTFSAPPHLADALAWAGYDGCSTASNHSIDQGFAGLVETLDVLETAGLGHAGTSATEAASRRITTYDAAGVRVAHLSATYGLNGLRLPSDAPWAVDLLDADRLVAQAGQAKEEGADFVVVSIHCCVEYDHQPTSYQVEVARALIDSPDVDLVVGHHAHVVQPIELRHDDYIVYGLGNFLSNQRTRTATNDGVIVTVEIAERGDRWATRGIRFTPTWVEAGSYRILPAGETIAAGSASSSLAAELAASWRRTASIIGRLDAADVVPTATP